MAPACHGLQLAGACRQAACLRLLVHPVAQQAQQRRLGLRVALGVRQRRQHVRQRGGRRGARHDAVRELEEDVTPVVTDGPGLNGQAVQCSSGSGHAGSTSIPVRTLYGLQAPYWVQMQTWAWSCGTLM